MHWLKHASFPVIFIRIFFLICGISFLPPVLGQTKSVLSSGKWFKIGITESGVYKLDANLLKRMGLDLSLVNPSKLQIYGNGGKMLPQNNADARPKDLIQNAIQVIGAEDGKFDSGDVIYFYAESPHTVIFDSLKTEWSHQTNCYTDTSFYFLTVGTSDGLRIKKNPSLSTSGKVINDFYDYWFHEIESVNLLRSGREWWGEYLGSNLAFQVDLPGIIPSSTIKFFGSVMGAAQINTRFLWQLNGQTVGESLIGAVGSGTYDIKGQKSVTRFDLSAGVTPTSSFSVAVNYDRNGQSSAQAYLDYMALQVKRELRSYDKQQIYRFLPESKDTITYNFNNAAENFNLWEITNPYEISSLLSGNSIGKTQSFTRSGGKLIRQFIGFTSGQAFEPVSWQPVSNQNITAENTPDLLIISSYLWQNEAKRLADFRREKDGLDVLVVTASLIYNEFGSGKPDPTAIRDFAKHLNDQNPGKLKYLLLFGDATYDYKNNLKNQSQSQRNSWIPVYESRESLNPVYTYSSDDYFGFLENNEGEWFESTSGDHTLDIGIGRLPVKSVDEARTMVDKLIRYSSSARTLGNWRNTISFVADDGDGNVHQSHANQLADLVGNDFLPSRIFLDAFPQTTTSEGQKVPAVNAAIKKNIDQGTLILNYTGHGGVSGWAEEQVLTLSDMLSARGYNNPPLWLTATCDFGRYDDPGLVSGAELMVLSPKGAAIGALSTTRPVYSSTNFTLSKAFYEALVKSGPETRLGDILKGTKNRALVGSLNRNFTLLGDPSMKLAKAERKVRWALKPDTLRALEKVSIGIEIFDPGNEIVDKSFEGTAHMIVYDKKTSFTTLGNEGNPEKYSEFRSKLFDGNVSVINGKLRCEFIMPKDIDYRTGIGRVSVYAVHADSLSDAGGQLDIVVGGSADLTTDITPPQIGGFIDNRTFEDGDLVSNEPVLYVELHDENGINVSRAGIGHDITLTLNDTLTIILNDYYTANLDSYQSGMVRYPFGQLPAGTYTARIKVWDVYTNFSEIAFRFQVGVPKGIQLTDWKIYPNPFINELSFELNHDRVNEDLEVTFSLFHNTGQRIGSETWKYYNSDSVIRQSLMFTKLEQLIFPLISYMYRVEIKSLKDNSIAKRSGKIIRSP